MRSSHVASVLRGIWTACVAACGCSGDEGQDLPKLLVNVPDAETIEGKLEGGGEVKHGFSSADGVSTLDFRGAGADGKPLATYQAVMRRTGEGEDGGVELKVSLEAHRPVRLVAGGGLGDVSVVQNGATVRQEGEPVELDLQPGRYDLIVLGRLR